MEKKKIAIIALDPQAGRSYQKDVESLFGDVAEITMYSVRDGSAMGVLPRADLFVASTDAYGSAEELSRHIPMGCESMGVEVSFRWSALRRLKELPEGSDVLFVNMTQTMAREAITQLQQFGINQVRWIPYFPGAPEPPESAAVAVTPDEMRYVPKHIRTVIDLGQRACTSGMMIEIALRLHLEHLLETEKFRAYSQSIAANNYSFDQMFAQSIRLESQFHILMGILSVGIIGVNEKGEIFACNHKAEEITRVSVDMILGKRAEEVFPYLPFSRCLEEKARIHPKVIRLDDVNISRELVPVMRQNTCIGAFAILQKFDEMEARQSGLRNQLFQKGHYAKYGFEDVIGKSAAIQRTRKTLERMAASESPILLIGETGTGKELFAHACHRASRRSDGPFVAINVAAFPENLLESELFGYEEGAFTGAKKGGRPGLFEFSHKGTLFLDEVEGMSPALQVKLLRVLQEREVMRVGGSRIIHVDVRIVAATNESLERKVAEGKFRRDLYYRLNTLPIVIPPLVQRGDDLFLIIDQFKKELGSDFTLTEPVRTFLKQYDWPGNIRELRNVVEYFIYTGSREITMDDLPPTVFRGAADRLRPVMAEAAEPASVPSPAAGEESPGFRFVLERLYRASEQNLSMGREKLLQEAREEHFPISQQEVRAILADMADRGLARVSRGRGGSQLTPEGRAYCENGQR